MREKLNLSNIPGGIPGTRKTIQEMYRHTVAGSHDPLVLRTAALMVSGIPERDYVGEAEAIYAGVRSLVRFVRDPSDAEFVSAPWQILRRGAGDCDDLSVLVSALARSIGFDTAFETVKANRLHPEQFSHVYALIDVPGRGWIPADASGDHEIGWRPPAAWGHRIWLEGGKTVDHNGMGDDRELTVGPYSDALTIQQVAEGATKKVIRDKMIADAVERGVPGSSGAGYSWMVRYTREKPWPDYAKKWVADAITDGRTWKPVYEAQDTDRALKLAGRAVPEAVRANPRYVSAFWLALQRLAESKIGTLQQDIQPQDIPLGEDAEPFIAVPTPESLAPTPEDVSMADDVARDAVSGDLGPEPEAKPFMLEEETAEAVETNAAAKVVEKTKAALNAVPGSVFIVGINLLGRAFGRKGK